MDRQKALEAALAQIDRAFGKGSVMKLGQKETMQVEAISTGSLGLDIALGVGGLPRGRVIEIYGPESSGKTTLALHAIAEAQKTGGTAAFVDAEHALDPVYARKLGVNIDELIVSQPDTGEQALEIVDTLVRSNAIDILVVDSVAALVPRAEIEGEMGDSHVGLQARLMSQSLRKLTGSISRSRCMVIFINQLRMKIGVMYGNPETTTGGNALKFYASVRLDIRRTGQIKDREEIVGNTTRVKVVKNKVAPPFKQVEFDIMYGQGISKIGEILDLGVKAGLVEKSGAWFSYDSIRIGQGRENAKTFLKDNPELMQRLEAAIRSRTDQVAEEMMVGADAEDGALRRIDDGQEARDAAAAQVGDGEGARRTRFDDAAAGLVGKLLRCAGQFFQGQGVGLGQHRHQQAILDGNRHPQVDVGLDHHAVLGDMAVQLREAAQGLRHRAQDQIVDADLHRGAGIACRAPRQRQ